MNIKHTVRRVVRTTKAAVHVACSVAEDLAIYAKRQNGQPKLRQSRVRGANLLVQANEDIGRGIYLFGEYEKDETNYIINQIQPSDICFDIGANIGYYTVLLAKKASSGQVHAFEPVELNYSILRTNTLLNQLGNVVTNHCAVGMDSGDTAFVVASDGAYSSIRNTGRKTIDREITVPIVTLDSYCSRIGLPRVDFMKVDVEGAEELVMIGAGQLLADRARRPRFMLLELETSMLETHNSSIDALICRLKRFGYEPFVITNSGLIPFRREHYEIVYNVCFVHSESAMTRARK